MNQVWCQNCGSQTEQVPTCPFCGHDLIRPVPTSPPVVPSKPPRRILARAMALLIVGIAFLLLLFFVVLPAVLLGDNHGGIGEGLRDWIGVLIVLGLYFLPSLIARRHRNINAICLLNLLLGWTFVGWVAALVWACYKEKE